MKGHTVSHCWASVSGHYGRLTAKRELSGPLGGSDVCAWRRFSTDYEKPETGTICPAAVDPLSTRVNVGAQDERNTDPRSQKEQGVGKSDFGQRGPWRREI
jgi:hypothetical protein